MPKVSKKCDVKFKIKYVHDTLSMYKNYINLPCNDKKKETEACLNIIVFFALVSASEHRLVGESGREHDQKPSMELFQSKFFNYTS